MTKRQIDAGDSSIPAAKRQSRLTFTPIKRNADNASRPKHQLLESHLAVIKSTHGSEERYRNFFEQYTLENISATLHRCFNPTLLQVLASRQEGDVQALRSIGGDIQFTKAGWYLNILTDETDPSWFALYPGQSVEVDKRIRYHQTHHKTRSSLHYFTWNQPCKKSVFVLLGSVPDGVRDQELVLNIGEQFLGAILQALPEQMLPQYLPAGIQVRLPHRGLMVARPMNQSHSNASSDSWMMWKSTNPLTRLYAETYYKESLDKGRETQVQQEQRGQISTERSKSMKAHLFRNPDPALGDMSEVLRWCRLCKTTQTLDQAPIYEVSTGRYIARKAPCDHCVETAPGRLARSKNGRKTTYHIPVDPKMPFIRQEDIK